MPNTFENMPIIDDSTVVDEIVLAPQGGRGLDLSARPAGPYGYGSAAEPFPKSLVIPRSEWQARAAERKAKRSRLRDMCDLAGLPPKDQQQTNYCWINAPTYCVEVLRAHQNQDKVLLSPASAGAQIKGYRNVGGWGQEGLQWISDHGLVPCDKWPANAIDQRYATEENKQLALKYRVTEWWELPARDIAPTISCLLLGIPVAVGLQWWSHEVTYLDVDWVDGQPAILFRNSWGPRYGDNGYGILQGQRAIPDDAVAPRVAVAS